MSGESLSGPDWSHPAITHSIDCKVKEVISAFTIDERTLMAGVKVESYYKVAANELVMRLRKFLLEWKPEPTVETTAVPAYHVYYIPSGTWQHFKLNHMPSWFVKWFPVLMTECHIPYTRTYNYRTEVTRICPHANLEWEKTSRDHIRFMFSDSEAVRWADADHVTAGEVNYWHRRLFPHLYYENGGPFRG